MSSRAIWGARSGPTGWSGNARYREMTGSAVIRCRSDRGTVPDHKIFLPHGQTKTIGWSKAYTANVSLTGLGVTASFSTSTETSRAVEFWTTKGRAWICGDKSELKDSTRIYANSY